MKKAATAAAILAASIVALTGCATAPNPATTVTVVPVIAAPDSTPSVEPRNPVDIVKLIDGCQTDESAELGKTALDGSRYAECHWNDMSGSSGTEVVLYTYAGDAKELSTHSLLTPDDSHRVIVGPDFVVSITGDWSKNGYSKHLTKEKLKSIADKVGGEVVTG